MANLVYKIDQTAIQWTDTTGDLACTLNNLAAGAGRQGAVKDLGAGGTARSRLYSWRASVEFETAPVVGELVELYLKVGDGTDYDNDDGTGNIALSAENKLKNCKFIGVIVVDEAAADIAMSASGQVEIDERYVMPIFFNNTADNLQATNDVNTFVLTPVPDQVQ